MLFIPQENVVPDITRPNCQLPLCNSSGSETRLNEPPTFSHHFLSSKRFPSV